MWPGAHATKIMQGGAYACMSGHEAAHPLHLSIGVSNPTIITFQLLRFPKYLLFYTNSNQLYHTRSHPGHLDPTPYQPDTRPT